jgi:hypothetical protein
MKRKDMRKGYTKAEMINELHMLLLNKEEYGFADRNVWNTCREWMAVRYKKWKKKFGMSKDRTVSSPGAYKRLTCNVRKVGCE